MALNEKVGAGQQPKQEKRQHTQHGTSIGFGSELQLLSVTSGSEYTNTISNNLQEIYNTLPVKPTITVLDKERMMNMDGYSYIVISMPDGAGRVVFHITLLETTGPKPLTANEIYTEAARSIREPNTPMRVYTPDDAINTRLHEMVLRELSNIYPGKDFTSVDGLVVHNTNMDLKELSIRIASIAFNAVHTEIKMSTGALSDINITETLQTSGNTVFKLETNLYHTTVKNVMGVPIRQDFKVDLVALDNRNSNFEFNADTRRLLTSTAGFVDAIREDIPVNTQYGMAPVVTTRLHPNLVITNTEIKNPTEGFMLLSTVAATVMIRPELWVQSLASIDPKSPNSPGSLNIITNLENNQNGVGVPLDLSSKEVTTEEHYTLLRQMYSLAPVLSVDVESFGHETYYMSVLAAAAGPGNSQSKRDALDEIVETCEQLTNGNFPSNFPRANIFATEGVVVPLGYWMDKSGERDIRDIDMAFIASQTSDVNLINKWGMTARPASVTSLDPFLTKCEIIKQLVPDAVINGKAIRITYTSEFLQTLVVGTEAAGLTARYESGAVINQQYDTKFFTDYLATAGLANAAGFGQQRASGGNGAYTAYSGMGYNRF